MTADSRPDARELYRLAALTLAFQFFVAVLGPTATGRARSALALAERFRGEIVNCDSTAVYRGFDIGTDKVPPDEQRGIPHHLIDVVDPAGEYTAAQYARDAAAVIRDIDAPRPSADRGRRHRFLLPRADARAVSRARTRRRVARRGSTRSPPEGRRAHCIAC